MGPGQDPSKGGKRFDLEVSDERLYDFWQNKEDGIIERIGTSIGDVTLAVTRDYGVLNLYAFPINGAELLLLEEAEVRVMGDILNEDYGIPVILKNDGFVRRDVTKWHLSVPRNEDFAPEPIHLSVSLNEYDDFQAFKARVNEFTTIAELFLQIYFSRPFQDPKAKGGEIPAPPVEDDELPKALPPKRPKIQIKGELAKNLFDKIYLQEAASVRFEDIKGQESAVKEMERLAKQIARPDLFLKWGVNPPRGILLYGPPGNGKTMMARALASESDAAFLLVSPSDLGSKWYGEAEKLAEAVFDIAEAVAAQHPSGRVIIFMDEVDAIIPHRGKDMHEASRKVLSVILQRIQGLMDGGNVTVIGATNRKEDIDEAFLSRMSLQIEMNRPNGPGLAAILKSHLDRKSVYAERVLYDVIDFDALGGELYKKGASGRDIEDIVNALVFDKATEEIEKGEGNVPLITTEDVRRIMQSIGKFSSEGKSNRLIGFRERFAS